MAGVIFTESWITADGWTNAALTAEWVHTLRINPSMQTHMDEDALSAPLHAALCQLRSFSNEESLADGWPLPRCCRLSPPGRTWGWQTMLPVDVYQRMNYHLNKQTRLQWLHCAVTALPLPGLDYCPGRSATPRPQDVFLTTRLY